MKRFSWEFKFAIYLIALSVLLYLIHFALYRDIHHIVFWGFTDLAFLPISVLFVSLVINRLLVMREKRAMLEKLNMVIGAFFSEVGTYLLTFLSDFDPGLDNIKKKLIVTKDWSEREFLEVGKGLRSHDYEIDIKRVDLGELRSFLVDKRNFLLRLLENPNLLEHESFTELLRAAFHLTEELEEREDFKKLPAADIEHLAGDMKRVYVLVAKEWLDYMKYLKNNYPYLFSLHERRGRIRAVCCKLLRSLESACGKTANPRPSKKCRRRKKLSFEPLWEEEETLPPCPCPLYYE